MYRWYAFKLVAKYDDWLVITQTADDATTRGSGADVVLVHRSEACRVFVGVCDSGVSLVVADFDTVDASCTIYVALPKFDD